MELCTLSRPTSCEGQGCAKPTADPPPTPQTSRPGNDEFKKFCSIIASSFMPPSFYFCFCCCSFFLFFFFVGFRASLSEFTWSVAAFHSVSVEMRHKNLGFQYICGLLCPTDTRFLYYIQHYNYVRVPTCV